MFAVPVALLMAIGGFCLAWVLFAILTYQPSPVQERLKAIKGEAYVYGQAPRAMFVDVVMQLKIVMWEKIEAVSRNLYGQKESYLKNIQHLLVAAGEGESSVAVWQFLTKRVFYSMFAGLAGFFLGLFTGMSFLVTLAMLISGLLAGGILAEMQLKMKGSGRKTAIQRSLPDTVDLLVVCLEAGLGLDAAIARVGEETARLAPALSYELKRLTLELSLGVTRADAFSSLAARTGVSDLRSLCSMIVQGDKLGTGMSDTLRIFSDDLRTKRRQRAEELAAKASIKMIFPLVFCIFPPMGIILMGPSLIGVLKFYVPVK
jgi:tight adherence protein C